MVFGEEDCRKLLREEGRLVEVIWPEVTAELVRFLSSQWMSCSMHPVAHVSKSCVQVGPLSLNLLKGEQHARVKRLLGQAFSEEAVAKVVPALIATSRAFCSRLGPIHPQFEQPGFTMSTAWHS